MGNLSKQILAEKENVEKALSNLKEAMEREEKMVVELAAMGTFLHNIYNGSLLQKSRKCHPERREGSYNSLIVKDSSLRSE